MLDHKVVLLFGSLGGFASGVGATSTWWSWTLAHAPMAGTLKNGKFTPYGADSTWLVLGAGGGLLAIVGVLGLLLVLRKINAAARAHV